MLFVHKWEILFQFLGLSTAPKPFPSGSTPYTTTAKSTLGTGVQILAQDIPLHETGEISGHIQCDQPLTVSIWQGSDPSVYSVVDTITVPASSLVAGAFVDGGGTTIGPLNVHGSLCKITVNNTGSATQNFLAQIRARV